MILIVAVEVRQVVAIPTVVVVGSFKLLDEMTEVLLFTVCI